MKNTKIFRVAMLLRSTMDNEKEIIGSDFLGCHFDYFQVRSLNELRDTFLKISHSYDGFITSGTFSDSVIRYYSDDPGICKRYFAASVENYYHQLLIQTMRNPSLKIENIRLDLMTTEHTLPEIIKSDSLQFLMNQEHDLINSMTPEQIIVFEDEMIRRLENAAVSGEYQLFMTRSQKAVKMFTRHHANYLYVKMTAKEMKDNIRELCRNMEIKALEAGQPATIFIRTKDSLSPDIVKEAVFEFFDSINISRPVLHLDQDFIEILTDAQTIRDITHEYTFCELTKFLVRKLWNFNIGYGIGNTFRDARRNAQIAERYAENAEKPHSQIYLVDTDNLIRVMSAESASPDSNEKRRKKAEILQALVKEIAGKSHLSSLNIMKLMMALQEQHKYEIDSVWVARELDTSPRMANKILSQLEKAGYATVTGKYMFSEKGRPNNIYHLSADFFRET